jgi:hypothetical protein
MANNLVIKLEADIARFQADMRTAGSSTQQAMVQMQKDAAMVGTAMGVMGVAAAAGLGLLVQNTINAADNLRDMAQKTGIAVETLNGLGFAASQAGGSLDSMVGAAGKLNKSIAEAASGTPAQAEAFKALGISVFDAGGKLKSADVVMAEMADKFVTYADGPEKVALSMALMGKSGADMIPVLNDGGTAMRENIVYAQQYSGITTELANASDNFNDTMGKLQLQQQGFANTLTAAVMPVLQAVADETLRAAEESDAFSIAAASARVVLQTFVVIGSEVAYTFRGVGTEIGGMAAQLAALASGDLSGFTAISDAMKADAARARIEHDAFIARVMAPLPAVVTSEGLPVDPKKPSAPRLPRPAATGRPEKSDSQKLEEDAQRFVSKLKEQTESYGLAGAELLKYQMGLSKFPAIYKEQAIAYQVQIDALRAADRAKKEAIQADMDGFKVMDDLRKADAAAVQRNEANVQAIQVGLMSDVDQQQFAHELILGNLQMFHDKKFENVALANSLIEQENTRHKENMKSMETASTQAMLGLAQSSAGQLYDAMRQAGLDQTALGKAVFFAQKAIQVATIIVNTEVAAAAAQAGMIASAGATAALAGPAGPAILAAGIAAGAGYATLTRAMGYATAGLVAGTALAGAREKGGPVWNGGAFLVGEKGPEIFRPTGSGNIIPNSALGGAGAPMTLTIVNNTSARIGQVTEQRISPTERALIIQEAVNANAAALSDPNSRTSRAMGRNYAAARSR